MKVNWAIIFLSVLFGIFKTAYFGWNFTPHSDVELICDGIVFLLCAMAFVRGEKGDLV